MLKPKLMSPFEQGAEPLRSFLHLLTTIIGGPAVFIELQCDCTREKHNVLSQCFLEKIKTPAQSGGEQKRGVRKS